jgi:hypothetical protein
MLEHNIRATDLNRRLDSRKWAYNLENRSAQLLGYVVENHVRLAVADKAVLAATSPIRRGGTGNGRQVDCLVGKDTWEIKLRVTDAASGQGRLSEELSFSEDSRLSGYRPILLVLSPAKSPQLDRLSKQFARQGGACFVGPHAWEYILQYATVEMQLFIRR